MIQRSIPYLAAALTLGVCLAACDARAQTPPADFDCTVAGADWSVRIEAGPTLADKADTASVSLVRADGGTALAPPFCVPLGPGQVVLAGFTLPRQPGETAEIRAQAYPTDDCSGSAFSTSTNACHAVVAPEPASPTLAP